MFLEEALDALRQSGDDLVLARVDGGDVERRLRVGNRDAPVGRVLDDLQGVRVLEERLGRDAPPDQAGPTERLLPLDDGGLETELGGADSGHIAAGAGANHHEVVSLGHERALLTRVSLSA